jgi:hypothetical protein
MVSFYMIMNSATRIHGIPAKSNGIISFAKIEPQPPSNHILAKNMGVGVPSPQKKQKGRSLSAPALKTNNLQPQPPCHTKQL